MGLLVTLTPGEIYLAMVLGLGTYLAMRGIIWYRNRG